LRNWKARPDDNRALAAFAAKRAESGPPWPDLLLIDGGKGPARSRVPALAEAGIGDAFALAAIAKGERRSQNELGCDFRTRAQKTL
jgi:excinuclease ABC subunit C